MDREQALKANRNGAIAACISAAITTLLILIALLIDPEPGGGPLAMYADPLLFVDVGLVLLCAYGMHRNSRTAAVFIFAYIIVSQLGFVMSTGRVTGIGVTLIFLYFYAKAIQGTFAFHRIEKAENPAYRAAPGWVIFVGAPVIGLFALLMGISLLTMTRVLPSTEVQHREQMLSADIARLKDAGIVDEDETVEYFFSYGLTSILQGGSVVTDKGVLIYFPDDDGELAIYQMMFDQIAEVERIEAGGMLSNSVYQLNGFEDDMWMQVELSTENRGDVRFIQAIRDGMGPRQ